MQLAVDVVLARAERGEVVERPGRLELGDRVRPTAPIRRRSPAISAPTIT